MNSQSYYAVVYFLKLLFDKEVSISQVSVPRISILSTQIFLYLIEDSFKIVIRLLLLCALNRALNKLSNVLTLARSLPLPSNQPRSLLEYRLSCQ